MTDYDLAHEATTRLIPHTKSRKNVEVIEGVIREVRRKQMHRTVLAGWFVCGGTALMSLLLYLFGAHDIGLYMLNCLAAIWLTVFLASP